MLRRGKVGALIAVTLLLASAPALAGGHAPISGIASYYSRNYHGRVASGAQYDPNKFTAAHRSLPFGTKLRVTNKHTKRSVTVIVNDRGPFTRGRVLDLSLAAAKALNMTDRGVVAVTAEVQ